MSTSAKEQFEAWWNGPRVSEPLAERAFKRLAWDAWRAGALSSTFRGNQDSSTETFRESPETSTNYPAILEGCVLVPLKETLEMAVAGGSAYDQWSDEYPSDVARRIWAAMIAAIPSRPPESDDRQTLRRLAVILSGNDAPGEIMALTVTAQSFVDRCKALVAERDELRKIVSAAQGDECTS